MDSRNKFTLEYSVEVVDNYVAIKCVPIHKEQEENEEKRKQGEKHKQQELVEIIEGFVSSMWEIVPDAFEHASSDPTYTSCPNIILNEKSDGYSIGYFRLTSNKDVKECVEQLNGFEFEGYTFIACPLPRELLYVPISKNPEDTKNRADVNRIIKSYQHNQLLINQRNEKNAKRMAKHKHMLMIEKEYLESKKEAASSNLAFLGGGRGGVMTRNGKVNTHSVQPHIVQPPPLLTDEELDSAVQCAIHQTLAEQRGEKTEREEHQQKKTEQKEGQEERQHEQCMLRTEFNIDAIRSQITDAIFMRYSEFVILDNITTEGNTIVLSLASKSKDIVAMLENGISIPIILKFK